MTFLERPPSTAWEQVPFAPSPHGFIWAWFRPAAAPHGLCLRIPDEVFRDALRGWTLTMRNLLHLVRIDPRQVATWVLYGVPNDGQQGANPAWDYTIPQPGPGVDPTIVVVLHAVWAGGARRRR